MNGFHKPEVHFSQLLKLMVFHNVLIIILPAVEIYDISYTVHSHIFIIYGFIANSQYDQLPVGFIAQLVEHCTGIAPEVMGSNPLQA